MDNRPPKILEKLLQRLLSGTDRESLPGDFEEMYLRIRNDSGSPAALLWYLVHILKLIPSNIMWSTAMFNNYLKIALRNIRRNKVFSSINIIGLALCITSSLLIGFHVNEELSFEKHIPDVKRIFRVTYDNAGRHWAVASPVLGSLLVKDIPEIEKAARLSKLSYPQILSYSSSEGILRKYEENGGLYADPAVVDMFNLKIIKGNQNNPLKEPSSIVITSRMAEKYFGDENPVGKILIDAKSKPFLITAVIEDAPVNTHLQFDYLISMSTFFKRLKDDGYDFLLTSKGWVYFYTYILINENSTQNNVQSKLPDFTVSFFGNESDRKSILANNSFILQPITDIHLYSKCESEISANSDIAYVYIFSAIAVFIILIAGINFVNILTAQSLRRIKEIEMRKVLGAKRKQLFSQFLGEPILLSLFAAIIAILFFKLSIPFYNALSCKSLHFSQLFSTVNIFIFITIVLLTGIFSGLYPSLVISGINPVNSNRTLFTRGSLRTGTKRGLIIFQFSISIFMIFSTIITYYQMQYFRNKDMGFDKEQVVAIKLDAVLSREFVSNAENYKTDILKSQNITSVATASHLPGEVPGVYPFKVESKASRGMRFLWVDEDYIETLNIKMLQGKSFADLPSKNPSFILNEAAAKVLDIENPVGLEGAETAMFKIRGKIAGVMSDYNFTSLHNNIEPLVIGFLPRQANYMIVKIEEGRIAEAIDYLKAKVEEIAPGSLFQYTFLDERINRLYSNEDRLLNLFKAFSILAVFISCLGLSGLSAFSAELRTKEIGIRKVVGASVQNIIINFSKEYITMVLISALIILPVSWYIMQNWLQNFSYRINIPWASIVYSVLISLITALVSVSYQAIRAAFANPANSLRNE